MLTKLLPEQVSRFWDTIRYAVEQSLPPIAGEHPDKMSRVLAAALADKAHVWASYQRGEDALKFEGLAITRILYDDVSDTKNLLIYCMYGYGKVDSKSWKEGFKTLAKYAKGKNCLQIIAYTNLPGVIKLATRLGADTKYTFLSFDVNEIIRNLDGLGLEIE